MERSESGSRRLPSSRSLALRASLELSALLVLIYPMLHIYVLLQGDLAAHKRGFFCDDQAIKYPNVNEEISTTKCFWMWSVVALLLVPAVETLHLASSSPSCLLQLIELYRVLGYLTLGALFTLLTTEMAKYKIGRLRPYFLSVCNIELTDELCRDEHGFARYVVDYQCAGDGYAVREASKSFLSGHASFSFYCATFLIVYLHARLRHISRNYNAGTGRHRRLTRIIIRTLKILKPFMQFGLFSLALYISLTRIVDYKHHAGDVVSGACLGVICAIIVLVFIVDFVNKPNVYEAKNSGRSDGDTHAMPLTISNQSSRIV